MELELVLAVADAAGPPGGAGLGRVVGLVLGGILCLRITFQVRRARAMQEQLEAEQAAADARARALAQRVGSTGLQRRQAGTQQLHQG